VGGEAPVTPVSSPDSSSWTFPTNRAITGYIKQLRSLVNLQLMKLWVLLPTYTHLGDVEEIFNPLSVSLGASES
jgi:hypothetical protein